MATFLKKINPWFIEQIEINFRIIIPKKGHHQPTIQKVHGSLKIKFLTQVPNSRCNKIL
jgi:hypothetical protein